MRGAYVGLVSLRARFKAGRCGSLGALTCGRRGLFLERRSYTGFLRLLSSKISLTDAPSLNHAVKLLIASGEISLYLSLTAERMISSVTTDRTLLGFG